MEHLATLPFQVLEALHLPARNERSFKLRPGALLTQRYLLGVPCGGLPPGPLLQAAQRLGMPAPLLEGFGQALEGASTALYGFEGAPDGTVVFKTYAEYRGRLRVACDTARARGHPAPAVELFRGFKWRHGAEDAGVQTVYTALPGLPPARLQAMAGRPPGDGAHGAHHAAVREAARRVLGHALAACPGCTPLWLDIAEAGRAVRAFDLNLYDAGLRVADAATHVNTLAQALGVEAGLVQGLLAVASDALLGHLSAGQGPDGQPYLTIYFEP
jgi:hypothetical protein